MTMNPEIFREYDIRGIAGRDMTEEDVVLIGKAAGTYLKERGHLKLSVGRDCQAIDPAGMAFEGFDTSTSGKIPHFHRLVV